MVAPASTIPRARASPIAASAVAAVAALTALANAGLHAYLVPEHLGPEMLGMGHGYIGVAFVAAIPLLIGDALALLAFPQLRVEAWHAGALLNAGMLALLVVSRLTSWLPNGYQEPWEPLAVASAAVEVVFLAAYLLRLCAREQGL